MIKVLVVDDSAVARDWIIYLLNSQPDITVIGVAKDGREAITAVLQLAPDVVTMDVMMPNMDGLEAARTIMAQTPVPIAIVSGHWDPNERANTFRALEEGALACVSKPRGIGHPDYEKNVKELVETVCALSKLKNLRSWWRPGKPVSTPVQNAPARRTLPAVEVVAIGVSTGGPPVLKTILAGLPREFPVPILIVQHIARGFLTGMVDWLAAAVSVPIRIPSHGERALGGHVYLAPDDFHFGVESQGNGVRMLLRDSEKENGVRPAASFLFRSVAKAFGKKAMAVLLTGMGKDGAEELRVLRERGALTIAQDKATSTVHGMPGEAIRLGAATYVLPPEKIAATLATLARGRGNQIGRRDSGTRSC